MSNDGNSDSDAATTAMVIALVILAAIAAASIMFGMSRRDRGAGGAAGTAGAEDRPPPPHSTSGHAHSAPPSSSANNYIVQNTVPLQKIEETDVDQASWRGAEASLLHATHIQPHHEYRSQMNPAGFLDAPAASQGGRRRAERVVLNELPAHNFLAAAHGDPPIGNTAHAHALGRLGALASIGAEGSVRAEAAHRTSALIDMQNFEGSSGQGAAFAAPAASPPPRASDYVFASATGSTDADAVHATLLARTQPVHGGPAPTMEQRQRLSLQQRRTGDQPARLFLNTIGSAVHHAVAPDGQGLAAHADADAAYPPASPAYYGERRVPRLRVMVSDCPCLRRAAVMPVVAC